MSAWGPHLSIIIWTMNWEPDLRIDEEVSSKANIAIPYVWHKNFEASRHIDVILHNVRTSPLGWRKTINLYRKPGEVGANLRLFLLDQLVSAALRQLGLLLRTRGITNWQHQISCPAGQSDGVESIKTLHLLIAIANKSGPFSWTYKVQRHTSASKIVVVHIASKTPQGQGISLYIQECWMSEISP